MDPILTQGEGYAIEDGHERYQPGRLSIEITSIEDSISIQGEGYALEDSHSRY